jgi:hypothetical protein
MAYRILESKFPAMKEEYRVIMNGATLEMLQDEAILAELLALDLTIDDIEVVDDLEQTS